MIQLVEKCFLDYGRTMAMTAQRTSARCLLRPTSPTAHPWTAGSSTSRWCLTLTRLCSRSCRAPSRPPSSQMIRASRTATSAASPRRADDTRAVINFMHDKPVPVDFETPVPCEAIRVTSPMTSRSARCPACRCPRNIVDGSEDREFIVTVANAGPDPATGTVTVTAIRRDGGTIEASPLIHVDL